MSFWRYDLAANADICLSAEPRALMWRVLIMVMQRRRTLAGEVMFLARVFSLTSLVMNGLRVEVTWMW